MASGGGCEAASLPPRSYSPTVESNDAVASVLPEGDHATCRTVLLWPVGTVSFSAKRTHSGFFAASTSSSLPSLPPPLRPLLYEKRRTSLSVEQVARSLERGFHAADQARSLWPGRVAMRSSDEDA